MRRFFVLLMLCAATANADESVSVCFNYGCAAQATVRFSPQQLSLIEQTLAGAGDAEHERQLLPQVVGQLYAWAGEQTPVHADRAGNYADAGADGAMDCIDHSTTTMRFLRLLEKRGALRFHRVIDVTRRGWIFRHFTATIEEIQPQALAAAPAAMSRRHRYAIDSWYVDNGKPAIVLPLEQWFTYGGPDV